jgi:hypothetical protein
LFSEVSKVGNVVKSNIARGKGKSLVNNAYFGLIDFTKTPFERSLKKLKLKVRRGRKFMI